MSDKPTVKSVVVTKHHGFLTFETEVGKGTIFTIRLPVNGERPELKAAAKEAKEAQSGG